MSGFSLRAALVFGGPVLVALAGCPGEESAEARAFAACQAYLDAVSARTVRCGGLAGSNTLRSRLVAECARSFGAPGALNLEATVTACADSLAMAPCSSELPASCRSKGSLEEGARCGADFQCKSGFCRGGTSESCGSCASVTPVGAPCASSEQCGDDARCSYGAEASGQCKAILTAKLGERCDSSAVRCADGLLCGKGQACVEPAASGAPCERTRDCADGLRCQSGRCAAPLGESMGCRLSEDACGPGLACSLDSKCAPIVYVRGGEPCGGARRCESGECKGEGSGDEGAPPSPGRCVDFLPDGAECGRAEQASSCQEPARCVAGRCTQRDLALCK